MHWSGEKATLTLAHLNKEDEGLYTLRINTKSGFETYSSYVYVKGEVTEPKRSSIETRLLLSTGDSALLINSFLHIRLYLYLLNSLGTCFHSLFSHIGVCVADYLGHLSCEK